MVARSDDPRIAAYRLLDDAAARREGLFIAEGVQTIRRMLDGGWPLHSLLILPGRASTLQDLVDEVERRGCPVYIAGNDVLDGVAGFRVHRGVIGLGLRPPGAAPASVIAGRGPVLVVEGVNDHENLGSIFRNAAAFGAAGVLLDPTTCDPLYRRSVRVSVGHVLDLPWSRVDPWPAGLEALEASGRVLVAMSPSGRRSLEEITDSNVAVLVGAEGPGLSEGALSVADEVVRIPMAGRVDSLNVAVAAAIALYALGLRSHPD